MPKLYRFLELLFLFLPIMAVPIGAYFFTNWWLLFGIVFFYIGALISIYIFTILAFIMTVIWLVTGVDIHDYGTFFFCCMLLGYILSRIVRKFKMLDDTDDLNELIEDAKRDIY